MKACAGQSILLIIFLFISGYSKSQTTRNYVVVIGVDGLSSWGLKKYSHQTIDSLMKQGVYTLSAKAVSPTLSAPNWASLLTGYKPKVHHIKSNHWKTDKNIYLEPPTVFQKLNMLHSNISQSVFYQWKEFEQLIERDSLNKYYCADEKATMEKATLKLIKESPQFTFIHLDNVDSSGHHFGLQSREYKHAISKVDSLIGNMINEIKQSNLKDHVYILITSDHGFWGKHHGGITRRERNIPWILVGPGIKSGHKIHSKLKTTETASVIYFLVSGRKDFNWNEKLMNELFQKE